MLLPLFQFSERMEYMYVLRVLPLEKNTKAEELMYFSSKDHPSGHLVEIPIRQKKKIGVVLSSQPVTELKSELKKTDFALKKIGAFAPNTIFNQKFMDALREVSKEWNFSFPALLKACVPTTILQSAIKRKIKNPTEIESTEKATGKFLIQENDDDRFSHYKSIIRENLARKNSVIFLTPTIEETERAYEKLSKGIESFTYLLHNSLPTSEIIKKWNLAVQNQKSILIIATPNFLCLPRKDIRAIILERENSRAYTSLQRPYADMRLVAEKVAKYFSSNLYLGDIVLRAETLFRYDQGHFVEFAPLKFRATTSASISAVGMNEIKKTEQYSWMISETMLNKIKETRNKNGRVFLFSARRGLAPSIICEDCQTAVTCEFCGSPMVLHGPNAYEKGNHFICHKCGNHRESGELCKKCRSWRLTPIGVGNEGVEKLLRKILPDSKIFKVDKDSVKTSNQAKEIVQKWYETPSGILIGTEMSLFHLWDQIETVGIVSLDSYLGLPDYRANEKVITLITRLKFLAKENFIIQSRLLDLPTIKYALEGNLADFFRNEFMERKKYFYPPFSNIVRISISGTPKKVATEMENLKKYFLPYDLKISPAYAKSKKGSVEISGFIKIDRQKWPEKELNEKILDLPPYVKVIVNSDSAF